MLNSADIIVVASVTANDNCNPLPPPSLMGPDLASNLFHLSTGRIITLISICILYTLGLYGYTDSCWYFIYIYIYRSYKCIPMYRYARAKRQLVYTVRLLFSIIKILRRYNTVVLSYIYVLYV